MGLIYAREKRATCREDAEPLLRAHWREIALNKDWIELAPDWIAYGVLEQLDKLRIFTARDENSSGLRGYFVVIVGVGLHYRKTKFATNDIIFLHPDYRRGMAGARLIKFAMSHLAAEGAEIMHINTKCHAPLDSLFDRMGFEHIENVYAKRLI